MRKTLLPFLAFMLAFLPFGPAHAGEFLLEIESGDSALSYELREELERAGTLEIAVQTLNDSFDIPHDVRIILGGEEGPLYDPETLEILIPHDFLISGFERHLAAVEDDLAESQANPYSEEPELDAHDIARDIMLDVLEHTLYHEAGHALIDLLELPVVGREEDAVDVLATLMVLGLYPEGGEIALNAAFDFVLLEWEEGGIHEEDLRGEHSLDSQRSHAISCLVLGSNPDRYSDLVQDFGIDGTERCADEFHRQRDNWFALLGDSLKSNRLFVLR